MATADEIQRVQTAYRRRILDCWNIRPGSRLLEIGCGQGDMTAVLAEAVGSDGWVTAVDIAEPTYGSPQTLQEATDAIKATHLGSRIEFHFERDVTNRGFVPDSYDGVVMAHCSWYFGAESQLIETLRAARQLAPTLYFVEWDTVPRTMDQLAHATAVQIQGQVEAFNTESVSNIRTPFTQQRLRRLIAQAGWEITVIADPGTEGLQDADWEIAECLANSSAMARKLNLPPRYIDWLEDQVEALRQVASVEEVHRPLDSVSFVAHQKV